MQLKHRMHLEEILNFGTETATRSCGLLYDNDGLKKLA